MGKAWEIFSAIKGFISGFGFFITSFSFVEYIKGHDEAIPFLFIGLIIGLGFWKNWKEG